MSGLDNKKMENKYFGPKKCLIAGAFATEAATLLRAGTLRKGLPVTLKKEPLNVHDKNAVAVFFSNIKIGYVPRGKNIEFTRFNAEKFEWLILSAKKVIGSDKNVAIEIYCPAGYMTPNRKPKATNSLPKATRPEFDRRESRNIIYEIRVAGKVEYIGKTTRRLSDRSSEHINMLRNNSHHNINLQMLYGIHGEELFEFRKIKSGLSASGLSYSEMDVMKRKNKRQYRETARRNRKYS